MTYRLGIDTGGTYTDAVLVDCNQQIIATAKCLTTRHDLTVGIENALNELPPDQLREAELVALSTTLSTNSVVEERGSRVAVLLPGYREQQVKKSGLLDIFTSELVVTLAGGHDATGGQRSALDELTARQEIERLAPRVSAFAISSMFGVRNPAHEIRLRELVTELSSRPVTCGHELASDLDAPRRALTAALNARMVPIIHELIDAVGKILRAKRVDAPLMMVKGDGSLVNTATARKQPVGTVLSGPAASVVGACALSGAKRAIIADMGGTTTDIAVVTGGVPELATDGVRIGGWKPMVEAVRVISIGLGGDSEVCFSGVSGVEIGPRRVVPLSLAARQFSNVLDAMKRQLTAAPDRRDNLFAMRLENDEVLLSACSSAELEAWELLGDQAVELKAITESNRDVARAIARLPRKGLAIYSGFTPSDAAHVLGYSNHWNAEAAEIAALIWARQMRQVYGLGHWSGGDAVTPSQHVFACVNQRIKQALIEAGLLHHRVLDQAETDKLTQLLAELVYESVDAPGEASDSCSLFHLKFATDYPVVAVGAPAATFFPAAASQLGVDLSLPAHGEVANAYGAVMGSVLQRAHVTVTQPRHGLFVVHSDREPIHLTTLDDAIATAETLAREKASNLALAAGATHLETRVSQEEKHVNHDVDGELFLEARVTATATGRAGYFS